MKSFTQQILESNKRFNVLTNKDMEEYSSKLSKDLPEDVRKMINLLIKYNINDESILNRIRHGSVTDLKSVSREIGIGQDNLDSMKKDLDKLGEDIKMLPLLINDEDRASLMSGDKNIEDITLDLESTRGRDRIVKQYSKLATSIAAKYRGKCGLDWNSLVSAANMGLVKAMNDYKRPVHSDMEDDKMKKLSFKQYAGYRIKQQILNDINNYSRTVHVTQHGVRKADEEGRTFTTVHIDWSEDGHGEGSLADKLDGLSVDPVAGKAKENGQLEKIFDMIDKKFPDKTLSIFYSYFGLHGYKKMSGVEIAKQYGVSGAAISQRVKQVVTWLQENKQTRGLLQELLDIYSESLISGSYKDLEEVLVEDKMFRFLEESWKYTSKEILINRIGDSLDNIPESEAILIEKCILCGDVNFIDDQLDEHKSSMEIFLKNMYPVRDERWSDTGLIESMLSIHDHLKDLEII